MKHITLGLTLAFLTFAPSQLSAQQQANSFEQLQLLVKPGDTVTVTDVNGALSRGIIAELSRTTIRLGVGGVARDLTEADVLQIRQRRSDSLKNGAVIGAIAGGAFGLLGMIIVCAEEEDCGAWVVPVFGLYTAMGTGIGVGVDALIVREQIIYQRPSRAGFRPIFSGGRKGIAFSVSF
jgi:hypothetical protein